VMKKFILLFCVLISPNILFARDSKYDWNYYGEGSADPKDGVHLFFSKQSIEKLDNGHFTVWTKGLSDIDTTKAFDNTQYKKELTDEAAFRLANSNPLILSVRKLDKDQRLSVIMMETVANYQTNIRPRGHVLYELDCTAKKMRYLSLDIIDKNGKIGHTSKADDWDYAIPETNSIYLLNLVCNN